MTNDPELPDRASVHPLPVIPRDQSTERVLTPVYVTKCFHRRFLVDEKLQEVECGDCHEKLSPMYVLTRLCSKENRYHELHARYHDELARLAARSRTTCQHCGKMTTISRS